MALSPPSNGSPFAIYIATHPGDYLYAKVLCASVRHFYPDVPILLLKDGDFSTVQVRQLGALRTTTCGVHRQRCKA